MTSMSQLSLFSPAKINLFLHITGKRSDGYHNLQTVFRLLDWGDTLHFYLTGRRFNPRAILSGDNLPITLTSNVAVTADIADNLITKAAIALIQSVKSKPQLSAIDLGNSLPVVEIELDKVIPTGSGLGGGSSNAATTLMALNQLWDFNVGQQALIDIASKVGADVPIFIFGKDAIAEGIGEQLSAVSLPKQYYLLLNPEAHASTQALFAHPKLLRNTAVIPVSQIQQHSEGYLQRLSPNYNNVFQPVVTEIVPEVHQALLYLQQLEPITDSTARMTGSGSSVFLPIPESLAAQLQRHMVNNPPPCQAIITQSLSV